MTVERTPLPGVGIRHTATTAAGQRLGIVSHVDGRRDIVLYDPDDPDRAACTVPLGPGEAQHIADLLNTTVTIDHVTELERQAGGITVARIRVPLSSTYDGRALGDLGGPACAGASVVAVIRDQQVTTAPGPDMVLHHDDVVVVAGDHRSVTAIAAILTIEHTPGG